MANDLEIRIGAELSEIKGALNSLQSELRETGTAGGRAGDKATKGFTGLERTINRATLAIGGFVSAYTAVQALRGVVRLSDQFAGFNAQLKLVTNSVDELNTAQREVYRIAQETRAPIQEVANTYATLSRSTAELEFSQEEIVRVLETVNKSIALTPVSAEAARASLTQFGQALSGDFKAGAQELNSILEQTPGLAIAIADGLDTIPANLKRMGEQGELSAERVFNALLRVSQEIDEQFKEVPMTVGGALTQLQNDVLTTFGEVDTSGLIASIQDLRDTLTDPGVQEGLMLLAQGLLGVASVSAEAASEFGNFGKQIAARFASMTGGLTDLDRIKLKIEDVDRAMSNSWMGRPMDYWFTADEDLPKIREQLVNELRAIEDQLGIAPQEEGETAEERTARLKEEADERLKLAKQVAEERAEKKRLEAEEKNRQKSIDKMIAGLNEEAATHGKSTAAIVAYRLENLGATQAEIDRAVALALTVEALEKKEQKDKDAKKAAEESARVQKQLASELLDVQARLLEAQGQTASATRMRLEAQYKDLIAGLREAGNEEGAGLVETLIDTEVSRAQFEEIKRQFDQTMSDLRAQQEAIANQVITGDLTPAVASDQQREAQAVALEQLTALTQQMQALAQATNDPQLVQGAQAATQALQQLGIQGMSGTAAAMADLRAQWDNLQRNFAKSAVNAGVDAVTQLFMDIAEGSKSAGDALKDFVRGFVASMAQIAARALATFLVLQLLDAVYPGLGRAVSVGMSAGASVNHGGGMAGTGPKRQVNPMLFMGAPRYHTGGMVGLKPDERPAILQTGEEVLSRQDPRNQANGGAPNGYRIVNVVDPSMAEEYINSAAGERAILNVISRNGGAVRESIGS